MFEGALHFQQADGFVAVTALQNSRERRNLRVQEAGALKGSFGFSLAFARAERLW